jgi:hypothetical protein
LRPIKDDVDDFFWFYFRCNSTLENEGTLYNVDCMPALDLSDASSWIRRREDATMQCPKTAQNSSSLVGVSQNSVIFIIKVLHSTVKVETY